MKNNSALIFSLFLVIGDFLALLAAFSVAYIFRVKLDTRPLIEQIPVFSYLRASFFVLPFWLLVHSFIGLYSQTVYEKRFSELGRLAVGSVLGILVVIGYDFVVGDNLFPARLVPVYALGLGFGFLLIFRTIARIIRRAMFRVGVGINNVLIIGNTKASENLVSAIRDTKTSGQKIVGLIDKKIAGFRCFETFSQAVRSLQHPVHSIIQTELYKDEDKNNEILKYSRENHVAYRFVPGNSDLFVGNIQVELYAGLPVVAVHQTALIGWGRILKRVFDFIVSSLLLIILSPIFVLIVVLQKIVEPSGDVFFRQTRLTRFDREFTLYKFRTLKRKYNGLLPEEGFTLMGKPELAKKFRENGDFLLRDPRLTRFGQFLRKSSLDELPQLLNVIKGDISLVGPRALVPRELSNYEKRHSVLSVKSGITGLAQISGRLNIGFEERRQLDIYYVQNWSFWWDIVILLKTFRVIINGSGSR